jgi:DNA-binding response OmpR family regulator
MGAGLAMFQAGAFDVVVTDFAMPEVNGAELALAIKRERPDVPIIMLTGLGALIAAPNPAPPGVDLVLGKPIGAMALRNAMRQVLSREAGRFRPDRREVPSLSQASAAGVLAP